MRRFIATDNDKVLSLISNLITILTFIASLTSGIIYIFISIEWVLIATIVLFITFIILLCKNKHFAKWLSVHLMNSTAPDKIYKISSRTVLHEYMTKSTVKCRDEINIKPLHSHDGID